VSEQSQMNMPSIEILERVEDTAWPSDRNFFEQRPRRRFRVRPAWSAEIEEFTCLAVIEQALLPNGFCWWVVVHQIKPGMRIRLPLAAPHNAPTEVTEAQARRVWAARSPAGCKKWLRGIRRKQRTLETRI